MSAKALAVMADLRHHGNGSPHDTSFGLDTHLLLNDAQSLDDLLLCRNVTP